MIIARHKTSISLENEFWRALWEIAGRRNMRLSELVTSIDAERVHPNLSSAIRLFVLTFYRLELEEMRARRPRKEPSTPTAGSASGVEGLKPPAPCSAQPWPRTRQRTHRHSPARASSSAPSR